MIYIIISAVDIFLTTISSYNAIYNFGRVSCSESSNVKVVFSIRLLRTSHSANIKHTQIMLQIICGFIPDWGWFLGLLDIWMGIHSPSETVACWVLVGSLQETKHGM